MFAEKTDTDHLLTRAELDELKHTEINQTIDRRTRDWMETNAIRLNERTREYLTWMRTAVGHQRNVSDEEIGKILTGFGGRFEKERSEARQEFNEQLMEIEKLQKLIGEQKAKLTQQIENLQKRIKQAQEQIGAKDEELQSLEQSIKEADVNKDEVTFAFEVDSIAANTREKRFSEYFHCRGIRWYLAVTQSTLSNDGRNFLIIALHAQNREEHNWRIVIDFELSILNQSGKKDMIVFELEDETFKNYHNNLGWANGILIEELESGGFLKDGKMKVQVKLKAKTKLIREARD